MKYKIQSQDNLKNLAFFYCSKRETSRFKLGQYLRRKCKEHKIEESVAKDWTEKVLDACEKSNMVNDDRYADLLIKNYSGRGKGVRYIQLKLKQKGLDFQKCTIVDNEEQEFIRAVTLAEKIMPRVSTQVLRRLARKTNSTWKPRHEHMEIQQKLIQKLIASGFTIDMSKKAAIQVMASFEIAKE